MFPEEDKYGTYAKLLLKYFLAEGIVSSHSLIVASQDSNCENLVSYGLILF
jgi:elongator complex protein 4